MFNKRGGMMFSREQLEGRAAELWPDNTSLQAKWVLACQYLQRTGKWVLFGGEVSWRDS